MTDEPTPNIPADTAPDDEPEAPVNPAAMIVPWVVRILLPVVMIAGTWYGVKWIRENQPEAQRKAPPPAVAQVDVQRLAPTDFTVRLPTRGSVQAEVSGDLVAQVSGVIVSMSPNFTDGGAFTEGQELLRLDARDYEVAIAQAEADVKQATIAIEQAQIAAQQVVIEVTQYETSIQAARAAVAEAQRAIDEETARGQQALAEWRQLNGDAPPSDLVVRKPQLAAAQAALDSAKAQLAQRIADQGLAKPRIAAAEATIAAREAALLAAQADLRSLQLDLERTVIRAPFTGRIEAREVNVGQYVSGGKRLAALYATETAEIRLPLTSRQLGFVDIPDGGEVDVDTLPPVVLRATHGDRQYEWTGRIVRTEGSMDAATRQLFVVARVESPYAPGLPGQPPLRVGMFVTASISGETIASVYVIPRGAVRGDNELFLVDEATMELTRRKVEPIWSDESVIVVREGLEPGELLCVSPVVFVGQRLPVVARWADSGQPLVEPESTGDRGGKGGKGTGKQGNAP